MKCQFALSYCASIIEYRFHNNQKAKMNSTRGTYYLTDETYQNEDKTEDFELRSDLLNILWNNERTSMAYNLLILLTVPLVMTAVIMLLIEIKV